MSCPVGLVWHQPPPPPSHVVNRFGRWLHLVGLLKADVDNDLSAVTRVTTMHQLGCHDSKQENPWIVSIVCEQQRLGA